MYDDAELFTRYHFRYADIMGQSIGRWPTLLRLFAGGSFQLVVDDLFGISKATVYRTAEAI